MARETLEPDAVDPDVDDDGAYVEDHDAPVAQPAGRRRRQWPRVVRTLVRLIVLAIFAALGLGALLVYQGTADPGGAAEYVALGGSYANGAGLGERADHSPWLCARSADNYAHRLAALRHLSLTDLTCRGATANNVLHGGQYFQQPQLNAIRPTTRLVTITVGAEDVGFLTNLYAWSCGRTPSAVPLLWQSTACAPMTQAEIDRASAVLGDQLVSIAAIAHKRAPQATVVFVDFPIVVPAKGSCPGRLPLSEGELALARTAQDNLNLQVAAAAAQTNSVLVKASALTATHDACSAQSWVTPFAFPITKLSFDPVGYQPTGDAMAAIAAEVDKVLTPKKKS